MTPKPRRRRTRPADPRDQAEALGYDTGSRAVDVVVEHVALGSRSTHPRARRAPRLRGMAGVTDGMLIAIGRFEAYMEHVEAGVGLGAPDMAADRVQEPTPGEAHGVALLPQERALGAAARYGQGVEAIGMQAMPIVAWVALAGMPVTQFARHHRMRRARASAMLVAALERLAEAYECA